MFNMDMERNECAPASSPPLRDNSVQVIIAIMIPRWLHMIEAVASTWEVRTFSHLH